MTTDNDAGTDVLDHSSKHNMTPHSDHSDTLKIAVVENGAEEVVRKSIDEVDAETDILAHSAEDLKNPKHVENDSKKIENIENGAETEEEVLSKKDFLTFQSNQPNHATTKRNI